MFEEAKGERKDNEWQSKKEKWHGNEQRQAKHEKQQQKWQGKKQWQSNNHWDWAATAAAKAKMNAAPINWDTLVFDLAEKIADDGHDMASFDTCLEELHLTLHTDFHNKEKIKTITDDGIKEVGDVKQELREASIIWKHANLKQIGLSDEVSDLKAQVTMLVARSIGSDEPAWKKARVE